MKFRTTAGAAIKHPGPALMIGVIHKDGKGYNISSTSARIANEIGGDTNALRHGLWSSILSSYFGRGVARDITDSHEGIGVADNFKIDFNKKFGSKNVDLADSIVDLLNNQIGIKIGEENPSNMTDKPAKDLMLEVLNIYKNTGLWTTKTDKDGNITIFRQKISEEKYNDAVNTLNTLDDKGFKK